MDSQAGEDMLEVEEAWILPQPSEDGKRGLPVGR